MEANLLAAEPSARGLRERKHGGEQEQPEDQARDYTGEEAGVERSPVRRFHRRLASMSLVVLAVVTYSDKEVEVVAAAPEEAVVQPEVIGEAERKAREEAKAAETAGAQGGAGGKEKEKDKEKK